MARPLAQPLALGQPGRRRTVSCSLAQLVALVLISETAEAA